MGVVLFKLVFLCNVLRCIILFFFSFLFWSLYFVPFINVRLLVTFCFGFWVLTRHNYYARSTKSTMNINSPTNCCSNCFLSSTVNKMGNKIPYCRKSKTNPMQIVERGNINTLNTHIHGCSLFWSSTGTSIKRGEVKLMIWDQTLIINGTTCHP
jgi:hypothetical protein